MRQLLIACLMLLLVGCAGLAERYQAMIESPEYKMACEAEAMLIAGAIAVKATPEYVAKSADFKAAYGKYLGAVEAHQAICRSQLRQ